MTTRWRIFLAAMVLIILPVGLLAGFFRAQLLEYAGRSFFGNARMQNRQILATPGELATQNQKQLTMLTEAALEDNRLRLALVGGRDDLLPYVRDYAGQVARTMTIDVLTLLDVQGTILSSAHYRNEFGRNDQQLLRALGEEQPLPGRFWQSHPDVWLDELPDPARPFSALIEEEGSSGTFLAMVTRHDFTLSGHQFHWIGGRRVDRNTIGHDTGVVLADTVLSEGDAPMVVADAASRESLLAWGQEHQVDWMAGDIPVVWNGHRETGLHLSYQHLEPWINQRQRVDQFIIAVVAAVIVGVFLLAAFLSGRLSRPLSDLAGQSTRIDLDDPAADFPTDRRDEVGQLSRVLSAMVQRLRRDARHLATAEHRATLGEVARQVNHDLRNGITPVRNVVRHLDETAANDPDRLAEVFQGRAATLTSSLAYLEELAGHYAKLTPELKRQPCDLADLARDACAAMPETQLTAAADTPAVLADPVAMRRILGNLLRNAREALPESGGQIKVSLARSEDPDLGPQCILAVADNGCGMTAEVRAHIFEDFYTTKPEGTGLGLSNVRRLAGDAGGHLEVDSAPDQGTTVTITFPAAEAEA